MTASPEPNITAIASIIAACVAATPPALTAITDVAIKLRGLSQEKRSPPLRVLKIIRKPVDIRYWRRVKRNFLIGIFLLVIGILFVLVNTLLYRLGFQYITLSNFGVIGTVWGLKINVIVVVNFLFLCFYIIAFTKAYKRMGSDPSDARHFLFKKAFLEDV
jgi:drug/metabolite transporter (DMT)-like permease